MLKRVALIAGCLAATTSALAAFPPSEGWQFAKWGMSQTQVRAASHGTVRASPASGVDELTSEYAMGKFKLNVSFQYVAPPDDPGSLDTSKFGLQSVTLDLDNKSGTCPALEAYLKTLYDKPSQVLTDSPSGDRWRSKAFGFVEYFTWGGKTCSVFYMSLDAASH